MYFLFGRPRTIESLQVEAALKPTNRAIAKIMVIDDQEFPYVEVLRKHQYSIHKVTDVSSITDVAEYTVILCDIRGVGKTLSSEFEGAHLLREIRQRYPFKTLVAYSAESLKTDYNEYLRNADFILQKDIGLDEWIAALDRAIALAADPASAWRRTRMKLLDACVPIHIVMQLEDQFVAYAQLKKTQFPSRELSSNLPETIKPFIDALVNTLALVKKLKS